MTISSVCDEKLKNLLELQNVGARKKKVFTPVRSSTEPFKLEGGGEHDDKLYFRTRQLNSSSADLSFGTNIASCPRHRVSSLHMIKI